MSTSKSYNFFIKLIRRKFNKSIMVFAIFFLIALMLWFINALDKNYTLTLQLHVEYNHIPKSKALESILPSTINANVQANGLTLLHFYLFNKNSIHAIDVNYLLHNYKVQKNILQIKTREIPEVADIFNSNFTLLTIDPENITFKFADLQSKKVAVKPITKFTFAQQFQLQNMVMVTPDSIQIYGAAKIIDTIDFVATEVCKKDNVSESFSENVKLQSIPNISFSKEKVLLVSKVEKFTEQKITIPIQLINVPDTLVADLMQHAAIVTLLVGISSSGDLQKNYKVIADYSKLQKHSGEIPLELINKPINGRVLKIEPQTVGFIIDKQ